VQVDPIKPTLKAPGTERLKLEYDEPASNLAFKFNLRRYHPSEPAFVATCNVCHRELEIGKGWRCETCHDYDICEAGAYTRPFLSSS
jgi:hypothetical protein